MKKYIDWQVSLLLTHTGKEEEEEDGVSVKYFHSSSYLSEQSCSSYEVIKTQ